MRSSFIEKNHDFYLYFDIMIYNCIILILFYIANFICKYKNNIDRKYIVFS